MHAITGIIVYDTNEENAVETAATILDEYEGDVWDYYIKGRGRFTCNFNKDVYRATDKEFFIALDLLIDAQYRNYESAKRMLNTFEEYDALYNDGIQTTPDWSGWHLMNYANLVEGKFTFDSYVFDSWDGTSRITKKMIESYKEQPEKFYLVLFDIHN